MLALQHVGGGTCRSNAHASKIISAVFPVLVFLCFFFLSCTAPCLVTKVNYKLRLLSDFWQMQNLIVRVINIRAVKLLLCYKLGKVCRER